MRFSLLGATYLLLLFVPNLLWARQRRTETARPKENALLLALERLGQVATTVAAIVSPPSAPPGTVRYGCLAASLLAMALYEISWMRYFRGPRTARELDRALGPIPLPLAILPVLGFMLLAAYQLHVYLLGAVLILAVGHVGIHWRHRITAS